MIAPGSQVRGVVSAIWLVTLGIAWLLAQAGAFYGVSWLSGPLGNRLEWIYAVFALSAVLLLGSDLLGRTDSHRGTAAGSTDGFPENTPGPAAGEAE